MHVKNEGFVSIRQRLDMHDMLIRCSLLLHHHQNILQRDTSFFVQWRIFTKSKNSLFMGLTKVDLPDNLIIERQIIVTWVRMKMIHLVDMRIRLLKVSVLIITLQNPAKVSTTKDLKQRLWRTYSKNWSSLTMIWLISISLSLKTGFI